VVHHESIMEGPTPAGRLACRNLVWRMGMRCN